MDESYGTYVDDEYFDNHEYDDTEILMMILMMIMSIRRIAILLLVLLPPRPDLAMPGKAGPSQTPKIPCFGMKWASDRCW